MRPLCPILHWCVGSTQVPLLLCTLEIPQNIAAQVLALNFSLFALLLSFSLNYELILYFCFCSFFQLYGSFNHANSTFLSFSEFSELFTSILLLSQHIEVILHFPQLGVTSDIIMSVLHESSMFFASLCILDVL